MNNHIRVTLCWAILVVCMILHFDYHVSELFYGIDIKKPDANGTVPTSILFIRSAFHFLPLLFVMGLLWWQGKAVRIINLVLSVLYTLAHAGHLAGELKKGDNPSQMVLLCVTLFISANLIAASWKWHKETATA